MTYFSNGDVDGDGVADPIDGNPNTGSLIDPANYDFEYYNNFKLAFVRVNNADHDVVVYRVWENPDRTLQGYALERIEYEDGN